MRGVCSARCVLLEAKSVPPRAVLTSPVHLELSISAFTPLQIGELMRPGGAREPGVGVGATRAVGFFTSGDQRKGAPREAQCRWGVLEARGGRSTELHVQSGRRESGWRKGDFN